jgi:hypothetical protein
MFLWPCPPAKCSSRWPTAACWPSTGLLTAISNASVTKHGGSITYGPSADAAPVFHTLATSSGGYYRLSLPDDIAVWLNA